MAAKSGRVGTPKGPVNGKSAFWSCYRKRRFAKKPEAQVALDELRRTSLRTLPNLHVYHCEHCRGYHVGTARARVGA